MALPGGEVAGVYHPYIGKFRCRQAGVLVAGGEVGTDGDVDKSVAGPGKAGKQGLVLAHTDCRCGAEAPPGGYVAENLLGCDGAPVYIVGPVLDYREGRQGQDVYKRQTQTSFTGN